MVTCNITNARKPEVRVRKILDPTDDDGTFNLTISGNVEYEDASHLDTSGWVVMSIGATPTVE
jgi:hypothetical protein